MYVNGVMIVWYLILELTKQIPRYWVTIVMSCVVAVGVLVYGATVCMVVFSVFLMTVTKTTVCVFVLQFDFYPPKKLNNRMQ